MYGELEKKNDSERVKLAFLLISYLFTVALLSYEWKYDVKAIFSSYC